MTGSVEACGACSRVVVACKEQDVRRGAEGLIRCYDHIGAQASAESLAALAAANMAAKPTPGLDQFEEEEVVVTASYVVDVAVRGWRRCGEEADFVEKALADARGLLNRGEYGDAHLAHEDVSKTGKRRLVDAQGKPWDEAAWVAAEATRRAGAKTQIGEAKRFVNAQLATEEPA